MLGQGAKEVIGIVKDVDVSEWRVYVDWLITGLDYKVAIKGYAASLHGPYQRKDVLAVFCM
jgi:hypothetical protein